MEPDLTSWASFVQWLTNPGINVVVGILLSIAVDYVPAYARLDFKGKRIVFGALSLIVPVVGAVLGVTTLGWPLDWAATFWPAIANGFAAFFSGTMKHLVKLPKAPEPE